MLDKQFVDSNCFLPLFGQLRLITLSPVGKSFLIMVIEHVAHMQLYFLLQKFASWLREA